jgi:hypothetical protein
MQRTYSRNISLLSFLSLLQNRFEMKNKIIYLQLVFLALCSFSFAQTNWNFVGSSTGIANVTEIDMEVSPAGDLYIAYIDPSLSNKITVKKWSGSANNFITLGTAGFSAANVSDLQLVITGNNTPAVSAVYNYMGDDYLDIYRFNGTSWNYQVIGSGGYNIIDKSKGYSMSGSSNGKLYLSFYNVNTQNTNYGTYNGEFITVNMTDYILYSTANPNLESSDVYHTVELMMDGTNAYVAHSEADMSNYIPYDISINGGTYNNQSLDNMDGATKIRIDKNSGNIVSNAWISDDNSPANPLYYRAYYGSGFNSRITLASTGASEMDMVAYGNDSYVLYKTNTCTLKKVSGVNSPIPLMSTISTGTSFIPSSATGLQLEMHNAGYVVAYIDGGKIYVKESSLGADIDDWDSNVMCEGSPFSTNFGAYVINENFSNSSLTMTVASQNVAVIPNSSLSTSFSQGFDFGASFSLNITGTNDVSTPTVVDILFTVKRNGVTLDTQLIPVTVNPKPDIVFNNVTNDVCKNAGPINLNPMASPAGGTWSGPGVLNNTFYPGVPNSATVVLGYTKTNQYGCTSTASSTPITINALPILTVTTTTSACNDSTGTASVSISGGSSPYTTHWSTGSNLSNISDLAAGQYVVTVVDNNNCMATSYAMVNSTGVSQTGITTFINCYGASTGGVNIIPSGGTAPLTYAWSNGATTQNITNVPAGPYELMITDAAGCVSSMTYMVEQSQPFSLDAQTINLSSCAMSNGSITMTVTGGNTPYVYSWKNINNLTVGTNSNSISNIPAGVYTCTITDANGCTYTTTHNLSSNNTSIFAIDTVINSSCLNDGEILTNSIMGQAQSYQWTNGASTQNINNLAPGTYSVLIVDTNNCETVISGTVNPELPESVEICMVTVDSISEKNLVVWEKPVSNAIDHFNIYRETSTAGLYQLVKMVNYNDLSQFVDSVASPAVRSWRYKISTSDGCGNESAISVHHKTIHLSTNLGLGGSVNLFWDSYEGFPYSNFVVKRYTTAEGWVTLATMPTNLFTYTDTPPSTAGLFYIVTVDAPSTCTSTTKAQDFNTTRSNRERNHFAVSGIADNSTPVQFIALYPNPVTGFLMVKNSSTEAIQGKIVDQTGRVIRELTLNAGETSIDCNDLANGVYCLELAGSKAKAQKRFVVSK